MRPCADLRAGKINDPCTTVLEIAKRQPEIEDRYHRLVVLIPEVQPMKPWQWLLHNQRGLILDRAIRRGTQNVVLCRLRYRLGTLAAQADAALSPSASE